MHILTSPDARYAPVRGRHLHHPRNIHGWEDGGPAYAGARELRGRSRGLPRGGLSGNEGGRRTTLAAALFAQPRLHASGTMGLTRRRRPLAAAVFSVARLLCARQALALGGTTD